jgi:hypothetical protein
LGAAGTELAPELRSADPVVMATAAGVAAVNATGEELLWRGLFVADFPDDPVWGWLWPAVGVPPAGVPGAAPRGLSSALVSFLP